MVHWLQEEIRDLLSPDVAAAASPSVHIREVVGGGVCLAGAHEKDVASKEQMAAVLEQVDTSWQQSISGMMPYIKTSPMGKSTPSMNAL